MGLSIQDWGAIGELASAILLFISLTYVGFQIQQTRKVMRIEAVQARTDSSNDLMKCFQDQSFAEYFVSFQGRTWNETDLAEKLGISRKSFGSSASTRLQISRYSFSNSSAVSK